MTQEDKMKILSYDKAIKALGIYLKIVKQIMPALADVDRKIILNFNSDIENMLKKIV